MNDLTIDQLYSQINRFFVQGRYVPALKLSKLGARRFPQSYASFAYLCICAAARLGDLKLACTLLEETLAAEGWYAEHVLRTTPTLKALQGHPLFERLVKESACLHRRAELAARPPEPLVLAADPAVPTRGTILALHGNGGAAQDEAHFWEPVLSLGWQLIMPGSSQEHWPGCEVWNDPERARRDVLNAWKQVNSGRLLVTAGFSVGAQAALRLTLDGTLPAYAYLGLSPYLPDLTGWPDLIQSCSRRPLRCAFLASQYDSSHQNLGRLVRLLTSHNIPANLEILPGHDHRYPADFDRVLGRTLQRIVPQA